MTGQQRDDDGLQALAQAVSGVVPDMAAILPAAGESRTDAVRPRYGDTDWPGGDVPPEAA